MSVEDKQMTRELTRELYRRRNLDLSDARINVARGVGYIGGVIRPAIGEYIHPKDELKTLQDVAKRVRGLRDLVIDARFEMGRRR
jgi:hypothetical protein